SVKYCRSGISIPASSWIRRCPRSLLSPYATLFRSNILIPNPRDIPGFVKELQKQKFSAFIGLNTLFVALCNNEDFQDLDFSGLKLTASGGMALTSDTAKMWERVTGCEISEGYGMTETSPVVTFNPRSAIQIGTIGLPIPSTIIKTIDDEGKETPI